MISHADIMVSPSEITQEPDTIQERIEKQVRGKLGTTNVRCHWDCLTYDTNSQQEEWVHVVDMRKEIEKLRKGTIPVPHLYCCTAVERVQEETGE